MVGIGLLQRGAILGRDDIHEELAVRLCRPDFVDFDLGFLHQVPIAVEHIAHDVADRGLVADRLGIVTRGGEEELEGREALLAIHNLKGRHLFDRWLGTAFEHDGAHEVGEASLATDEALDGLGTNILPEWFPLLLAIPDVVALINRNAIAVPVLQQRSDLDRPRLHAPIPW